MPADASASYAWVTTVDKTSPLVDQVRPGDLIAGVNSIDMKGKHVDFITGVMLGSANDPSRSVTLLRRAPSSGSVNTDKENTVNLPMTTPKNPDPASNAFIKLTPPRKNAASKRPLAATSNTKGPPQKNQAPTKRKKTQQKKLPPPPFEMPDEIPEPGFVSVDQKFYSTLNNETLSKVADKLGTDWKTMAALPENTSRYGELKASSRFLPSTLLFIPDNRSKWKMKQLSKTEEVETEECVDCGIMSNPAEMLMCDGCDALHHISCVGLPAVPDGDWFCGSCLKILEARAKINPGEDSAFELAALPPLKLSSGYEKGQVATKLRSYLLNRSARDFANLKDNNKAKRESFQDRERELKESESRIAAEVTLSVKEYDEAFKLAMRHHGVAAWTLGEANKSRNFIKLREEGGTIVTLNEMQEIEIEASVTLRNHRATVMSERWNRALELMKRVCNEPNVKRLATKKKNLQEQLSSTRKALGKLQNEVRGIPQVERTEHRRLELEYADLLSECNLRNETKAAYKQREFPPRFMGRVQLADEADVLALNMLLEPDELILAIPVGHHGQEFEPQVGRAYEIYARMLLFDKARDDALPMENNGVRDAQRSLFALLSSNDFNKEIIATRPSIPPTVKLRHNDNNVTRCFDLAELVRDCNVDLDLPKEPTPTFLAANGLELRDYQQSSLRWMLDKEKETTGLGLAGDLWHRLRFLDSSAPVDFFYCDLTGSFALDIFDYRTDAEQKDASINRFAMPTGGVLGEEVRECQTFELEAVLS